MGSEKWLNWDTTELIAEDGRIYRIFYNEDGSEFKRVYGGLVTTRTYVARPEITVSRRGDPKAYHREYYRQVRSKAQGRVPRGPYKKTI